MKRRPWVTAAVVGAAVVVAAAIGGWWSLRAAASVNGADVVWFASEPAQPGMAVVKVVDRNMVGVAGVRLNAMADQDSRMATATTDDSGLAQMRLDPPRLGRLVVGGVDVLDRPWWWAPSAARGLRMVVTITDPSLIRAERRVTPEEAAQLGANEREYLERARTVLTDGESEDWKAAWRDLVLMGEPGWALLTGCLFDLTPQTDHLRGAAPFIDPGRRSGDGFYLAYQAELRRRLADEDWAMAWARSVLTQLEGAAMMRRPWVGSYSDPSEARLDIAFARLVYGKRMGYPWGGPADQQREAIARWHEYLASLAAAAAPVPDEGASNPLRPRWQRYQEFGVP